ncbi:CRISPR-associated helicase Cas3' [Streptomyces polyrhachis]|uniref:CRISPR-associated helicase Cas3 n=1 Tax=Streptomyces polyrhachis TaxID=1282885 RepID=A0ABW2GBF6_9ACTN
MMDVLSVLLAKSESSTRAKELLTEHLRDTLAAAVQLRRRVGQLTAAEKVFGGRFWTAVELAALTHDAGKIPEGFQDMVAGRTRAWGERHEVLSLGFLPGLIMDPPLLSWVAAAVATHHRALTRAPDPATPASLDRRNLAWQYGTVSAAEYHERFQPIPAKAVAALADWLRTTAHASRPQDVPAHGPTLTEEQLLARAHELLYQLLDYWEEKVSPEEGLAAVLLQGAVTLSDHLSSAHGSLSTQQPLDADFRSRLERQLAAGGKALRAHQLRAAAVEGHLLLRAPTGSGKTEAALLWAAGQVSGLQEATGGVPRVFFTLPYLASINAMARRLEITLESPGAVGVSHSRAASYHLAVAISSEDEDQDEGGSPCRIDAASKALSRAAATKLFHESVRIATPYQLLRAALAGPAHAGILVDAANSVFILDELHAYDARRLGYILASARLWERLGGRVAVLSATLPHALASLFTQTLTGTTTQLDALDFDLPARHLLRIRDHHLTDPAALAEIRRQLSENKSVLVVANNVADALELFNQLAPAVQEQHGSDAALLLHSRFKRGDRSHIERRIAERFATVSPDAQHTRRPGLLVATQVVEVSLDVDFDVLFTSAAPLEALLQRFGRVNRIAARPAAEVIVHYPSWTTRGKRPDEYADGVYPRVPVEKGWGILRSHDGRTVDEADATSWLDSIYADTWGQQWRNDVIGHREQFDHDFLQFRLPFHDRSALSDGFDELFDGTEAILEQDREDYIAALAEAGTGRKAAGRLLADEYLIPVPHWAGDLSRYEKQLKVRVLDGDYDPERGLLAVRGHPQQRYQLGEVL